MPVTKQYKINPSIPEYGLHIKEVKKTIRTKAVREGTVDGKKEEIYVDERVKVYECDLEYFKIFKAGVEVLTLLSSAGITVLSYILNHCLNYDSDKLIIIPKECARVCHITLGTVSKGMNNLIDNEVIYCTDSKVIYWMNITMFHKGDVDKLYKEYISTVLR